MSTADLSDIKERMQREGKRLGWAAFGVAVGIDGETLRQFAVNPERRAHRDTIAAVERYFTPPAAGEVQAKAAQALALIQQGQALLSEVVRLLPMDPDIAETVSSAPDATPASAVPGRKKEGRTSGRAG